MSKKKYLILSLTIVSIIGILIPVLFLAKPTKTSKDSYISNLNVAVGLDTTDNLFYAQTDTKVEFSYNHRDEGLSSIIEYRINENEWIYLKKLNKSSPWLQVFIIERLERGSEYKLDVRINYDNSKILTESFNTMRDYGYPTFMPEPSRLKVSSILHLGKDNFLSFWIYWLRIDYWRDKEYYFDVFILDQNEIDDYLNNIFPPKEKSIAYIEPESDSSFLTHIHYNGNLKNNETYYVAFEIYRWVPLFDVYHVFWIAYPIS